MHIRAAFVRTVLLFSCLVMLSLQASAADIDLTGFGGIQRQGKLTIRSAPSTTTQLVRELNSTTFGVFGFRISHGHVIGGEHTLALASNFIDADTKSLIYNSDLLVQAPLPVVRPYGTAGLGLIHTWGDGLGVMGTKFAFNYGGGVKFMPAGPVGIRFDVRGYTVPSAEFKLFQSESQRLDFLEATVGIVYSFGR